MSMKCDLKITRMKIAVLIFLEVALVFLIFNTFFNPSVEGDVGENVSVIVNLTVGEVSPEILNVTLQNEAVITLIANDTATVYCEAVIRDYNNDDTISTVTAEFFDNAFSSYGGGDDNNTHYTNSSCNISTDFGTWNEVTDDDYLALANCTFEVYYYANATTWNCSVWVNDTSGLDGFGSGTGTINQLLAVGLPSYINYGTVNATYVSAENATNVTNVGNVDLNLSLSGYGRTEGDGWAMNCTLGSLGGILLGFQKYNLTESHNYGMSLSDFDVNYTNLTSSPTVKTFHLLQRQNDTNQNVDDYNTTYWRIYVPLGVAGTCNGTIIFGATTAVGTG